MTITYINSTQYVVASPIPLVIDTRTLDIGTRSKGFIGVCVNVLLRIGSGSDGDVIGVTWNGVALAKAVESGDPTHAADFWWLGDPASGSNNLVVNFSGTGSTTGATTYSIYVVWYDSDNDVEVGDTTTSLNPNTTSPIAINIDPTAPGAACLSAYSTADNNVATDAATTLVQNWDSGGNCSGLNRLDAGAAGTYTFSWARGGAGRAAPFNIIAVALQEADAGSAPTVALNSPEDAGTVITDQPTLVFTGNDADGDPIRYNVQISDSDEFISGDSLKTEVSETAGSGGLTVHPNPSPGVAWTGYPQVDDRPAQLFQGRGALIKSIGFHFGPHETLPGDTNGEYTVYIHPVDGGVRGDSTITRWQASTAYSLGDLVAQVGTTNDLQQFLYECTTAGISGGSEPTWTEIEDDTISDNTVVWTAHRGAGPLNPATPANTPTPNWIAQSEVIAYNPGGYEANDWKDCNFTGANSIRTVRGAWYVAVLDWRPANYTTTNTLTVMLRMGVGHEGNAYLDGANPTNNGPRVFDDFAFRVTEEFTLLDKVSGTDSGFTGSPDNTDPFASDQAVSYTVQEVDALDDGASYLWKVRGLDPAPGSGVWGEFSSVREFTVEISEPGISGSLSKQTDDAILVASGDVYNSGSLNDSLDDALLVSSGEVHISGSVNEIADDATLVSIAELYIFVALSESLDDAVLIASGTITDLPVISGVFSETTDDATLTGAAEVYISGSLAESADDATLVGSAEVYISGSLAESIDDSTLVGAAEVYISGSLAESIDDSTLVGAAEVYISGSLAESIADATLVASGLVSAIPQTVGYLDESTEDATLVSTAEAYVIGFVGKALDDSVLISSAEVYVIASMSEEIDDAQLVSSAEVYVSSTLSVQLDSATLVSTGIITEIPPIVGDLNVSLSDATIISNGSVEGAIPAYGSLSVTLEDADLFASGDVISTSVSSVYLEDAILIANAETLVQGYVSAILEDASLDATNIPTIDYPLHTSRQFIIEPRNRAGVVSVRNRQYKIVVREDN